ncbi:hypothetical protein [Cupriavidus taiwanensis]|uniref:Uncharacterized protein n=1 Tax=Cupriavidus taiwanensis TaxID=164546 RepID=A0A375JDJ8_9BURK|nr:hypothetical protein [Cupriavidus taiwanensis]SPS02892.1 conserved hypothetical protein [Cupriavidus taiwanensis]
MVFFEFSKQGVSAFVSFWQENRTHQLWVSGGALSQQEVDDLRATGMSVSVFTHEVDPESAGAMAHAIDVIREHHPSEVIWSEAQAS